MTLDEKRIRIADFMDNGWCRMCGVYHLVPGTGVDHQCTYVPDYLEDKNAMVDVLKRLPASKRTEFGEWLLTGMLHKDVIADYPVTLATRDDASELCGSLDLVYHIAQAPAWMLAQAFAETMALWKETPP